MAFNSMFKCINFEWNETKKRTHIQYEQRKSFVIQVHFSNRNHEFPINNLATSQLTVQFLIVLLYFSGPHSCYHVSFFPSECKYKWKQGTHLSEANCYFKFENEKKMWVQHMTTKFRSYSVSSLFRFIFRCVFILVSWKSNISKNTFHLMLNVECYFSRIDLLFYRSKSTSNCLNAQTQNCMREFKQSSFQ